MIGDASLAATLVRLPRRCKMLIVSAIVRAGPPPLSTSNSLDPRCRCPIRCYAKGSYLAPFKARKVGSVAAQWRDRHRDCQAPLGLGLEFCSVSLRPYQDLSEGEECGLSAPATIRDPGSSSPRRCVASTLMLEGDGIGICRLSCASIGRLRCSCGRMLRSRLSAVGIGLCMLF